MSWPGDRWTGRSRSWTAEDVGWAMLIVLAGVMMFSTAMGQLLAGALLLILIARPSGIGRTQVLRSPVVVAILVFAAARALAILTSVALSVSVESAWKELPFYALVVIVATLWAEGREDQIVLWLKVGCVSAAIAGALGAVRYLGGWDHRASSITSGYYTLGMYLTMWLAVTASLGRVRQVFTSRWTWWVLLAGQCAGILLTFNRVHWAAAGLVLIAVAAWQERRLLFVAAAGSIVAVIAVPYLLVRFTEMVHPLANLSDRDIVWRAAWEMAGGRPTTGWGLRTFPLIFPYRELLADKGVASWHNELIQVYMESGILGFAGLAGVWISAAVVWVRAWRHTAGLALGRAITAGVGLALTSYLVSGMAGVFLADPIAGTLWKIFLGILAGIAVSTVPSISGPGSASSVQRTSV